MNPSAERFIDLATRPLEKNLELHSAAAAALSERFAANPEAPEETQCAADALAAADHRPRRRLWRVALAWLALALSLPVLTHTLWQLRQYIGAAYVLSPQPKTPGLDPARHLSDQERLILRGDPDAGSEAGRWKALWKSVPDNRAYLLEYAKASYADRKMFSPDILEAAARIDPDNAWYDLMQAASKAERGVEKKIPGYDARERGEKITYNVRDEAALKEALDALHQATRKARFVATDPELLRQRVGLLPERVDFASQPSGLILAASQIPGTVPCRYLADAISLEAKRCAERNDVAGYRQLVADWKWLVGSLAGDGRSLLDQVVAKAVLTIPLAGLADAAKALGLEKEAEFFGPLRDWHDPENRKKRQRHAMDRDLSSEFVEMKGSVMARLTLPMGRRQVENPPLLTEVDLLPGRLADHALFGRAWALASWTLLGILAGMVALARLRGAEVIRGLGNRFQDLFGIRDWVWILGGGSVLPLLWAFLIIQFTPLSTREWGMSFSTFTGPGVQLGAVTALILTASAVIVSRRLAKRAGFLGLKSRWPKLGLAAVFCAALAVPLAGTLPYIGMLAIEISGALIGVALLWLVWRGAAVWFSLGKPPARSLRAAVQLRMAGPVLIFGMAVLPLLAAAFYAEERHWISRDWPMEISTDSAGVRYEQQVAEVLKGELMETLRSLPES